MRVAGNIPLNQPVPLEEVDAVKLKSRLHSDNTEMVDGEASDFILNRSDLALVNEQAADEVDGLLGILAVSRVSRFVDVNQIHGQTSRVGSTTGVHAR